MLNIRVKLVPAAVLNKGTDCRARQLLNILLKPVPDAVLSRGTDWSE